MEDKAALFSGSWPRARRVVEQAIALRAIPGAVVEVRVGGELRTRFAAGQAACRPKARPMCEDTWFDLASLTKVLATTPAILALAEDGAISLDEPASRFLPELVGDHAVFTIRHLLTHVSGLPADLPWRTLRPPVESIPQVVEDMPLQGAPGERIVYSDVGFLLLGEVVRRVSGRPLDEFVSERIHGPLGAHLRFGPLPPEQCAATEDDPDGGGPIVGVVHDEKSRVLGGVTGHAGLFGTTDGVARVVEMLRCGGRGADGMPILAEATVTQALRPWVEGPDGMRRALGYELSGGGNSAGDLFGPRAFGHTGFTGTSVWVDPDLALTLVVLTNRVHFGRENQGIRWLRTRMANAVVADLEHGQGGGASWQS